jgi:hypothetical protein
MAIIASIYTRGAATAYGPCSDGQVATLLIHQTDQIILGLFLPIALLIYHVVTMPFLAIEDLSALHRSALTLAMSTPDVKPTLSGRAWGDSVLRY